MLKTLRKGTKVAGNAIVSWLLLIIVTGILVAGYFKYFGNSLDKNDVTKVATDLRTNLTDLSAQVRNWADVTINTPSVVNKLKTQYNDSVIVLKKGVTVDTAFPVAGVDLSGTTLDGVAAGIYNKNKYLVLESNASIADTGVILDGTTDYGFSAANNNADEAGLTYRGVYFLVNADEKPTFDKIAEANIGRITVLPARNVQDSIQTTPVSAILVQLSNVGEQ